MKWLRKHWKKIVAVLLVVPLLVWAIRWIVIIFSDMRGPDLTDLERGLRTDLEGLDDKERELLGEVDREADELKDGIDRGDPGAAEVFNRELEDDDEDE
jgi:hypothetical protein